jgi:hypothetical protein
MDQLEHRSFRVSNAKTIFTRVIFLKSVLNKDAYFLDLLETFEKRKVFKRVLTFIVQSRVAVKKVFFSQTTKLVKK